MAENKKSFVLYCDLIKSIEHLTFEEKGILFNHLLEYVNDKNPILEDRLVLTAWKPIELQLKRDLIKFEEVKSKRSDAGKRSAELRALKSDEQNITNSTNVESVQQISTNSTVNDTDNVNVNVNVTTIEIITFDDAVNICLFSEQWKEDIERLYKIDRNKIHFALQEFKLHCGTTGDNKPRSLNQFKKHFTNWVRVKKQYQIKTEIKDKL